MRTWLIVPMLFLCLCAEAFAQTITSETFDTALTGWSFAAGTAEWSSVDSGGHSNSGSAKLTNMLPTSFASVKISRCLTVTPPVVSYVAGARSRLGDGATASGSTQLNVDFFNSSDCTGLEVYGINIGIGATTAWSRNLFSWAFSPPLAGVHSVLVSPSLFKTSTGGGVVTAHFDDVLVGINAAVTLTQDRFSVGTAWKTVDGQIGLGSPVKLTTDSAYFWFFSPTNVELIVKVLDACTYNNRFWFFAGGLTNVETFLTVTDTQRRNYRAYLSPQGKAFVPIQDTDALATCP
jgi:hypothetical protein